MSLDIEAIKARCEAATEGPWFVDRVGEINDPSWHIADAIRWQGWTNALRFDEDRETAEFVAHARADVPALVAEVERLRAELAWVRSVITLHQQNGCGRELAELGETKGGDTPPYVGKGF